MTNTIVILGGSFAGLKIAHSLLKTTAPAVKDLKVILVSSSSHMYFNLAVPRAIVPGQIEDSKIFGPIEPAFSKYPPQKFKFVVGTATSVDPDKKAVVVETASGTQVVAYDTLVVTTGSRAIGEVPWKGSGSYEETRRLLHDIQEKIKSAQSIVVGGAGVTGVEVAGELGFEYGNKKEITLISKDATILKNFVGPQLGVSALKELKNQNVKVIFNTRIISSTTLPSGKTELALSTDKKIVTDVYLPSMGLEANSSFMPRNLLNAKGEIMVDEYMAVKGAKDIWACGDVADIQRNKVLYVGQQAPHLAQNLHATLTGKPNRPYKPDNKPMGAVTVGRSKGYGQMGSWSLPSFFIYFLKGKTMMVENLSKVLNGQM